MRTMRQLIDRALGCRLDCVYPLFGVRKMSVGVGTVEIVENISSGCFICRVYDKDGNYVTQCVTNQDISEASKAEIEKLIRESGRKI